MTLLKFVVFYIGMTGGLSTYKYCRHMGAEYDGSKAKKVVFIRVLPY